MTALLVGLVLLAFVLGLTVSAWVIRRSRTRWLLAGQRQAELTGGQRAPAVSGEAWNSPELLRHRQRSPDVKPGSPRPMRPVFERAPSPR